MPSVTVSYDSPHLILDLLEANDNRIRAISDASRKEAVIPARSAEEVASIVREGKVASFFLAESEASVRSLMRHMPVGEVLGWEYSKDSLGEGPDILVPRTKGKLCYASRRV
jgi:hypothetical protein